MGTVRTTKAFLPLLKQQVKEGTHTAPRILNLASMAGKAYGGSVAYGTSKHATVAFSHGLRLELTRPWGIQVCAICPTFHGTPMVANSMEHFENYLQALPKDVVDENGEGTFLRWDLL